jgi:aminopeptidase N
MRLRAHIRTPAILAAVSIVLCGSSGRAQPAGGLPEYADTTEGKAAWAVREGRGDGGSVPEIPPDTSGFDALHVQLILEPDFTEREIRGEVLWTLCMTAAPPAIAFDFHDSLAIDAAQIGGSPAEITRGNRRIALKPAAPLVAGDTIRVWLTYHGRPRPGFLGGFAFGQHADGDIAYTNSEPVAARTWWPCKDRPDDKFTADLIFIVPDTMIAASNGVLMSATSIEGGRRCFHWRTQYPMATYLVSLVATNFATFEDAYPTLSGRVMPLSYYAFPSDLAAAQEEWAVTPRAIRALAELFGEYPFVTEKYGMAEYPWAGAMEHQTLTSMGAYFLHLPGQHDWVIVHELAHQWWGDAVTCGSWRDIWLNEGFATYCEALWAEHLAGPDSLRHAMRTKKDRYYPGSCYAPDFLFNSTVYRKGAWVLHMLRHVVGDDAFFEGLRGYLAAHAYGVAVTADLERAFEDVWGHELGWFFDEWVYREGMPSYGIFLEPVAGDGSGRALTEIRIIQETSGPAPMRMPLDACLRLSDGSEFCTVLWDSLAEQSFLVETDRPPVSLAIDPGEWVLCTIHYGQYPSLVREEDLASQRVAGTILLGAPRPNPSSGVTWISFALPPPSSPADASPASTAIDIAIFDAMGRLVTMLDAANERSARGGHVVWRGVDRAGDQVPAGIYFARGRTAPAAPWSAPRRVLVVR